MIEPLSSDPTTLVIYQLTNRSHQDRAGTDSARDSDFVRLGAAEDHAVARAVQRGLRSGVNESLLFGRFEGAIAISSPTP